jgi:hypothetical protein
MIGLQEFLALTKGARARYCNGMVFSLKLPPTGRLSPAPERIPDTDWHECFVPVKYGRSTSYIDGLPSRLRMCKMLATANARLPYLRQKTDFAPDTGLEPLHPLRPRSDTDLDSEVLVSKFHDPVLWTAVGILSASWTEYTRQQIPAGDRRQWQAEWISWAVLFAVAQCSLFLRSRLGHDAAGEQGRSEAGRLAVGDLNVLAVAVANAVAHSLSLYFELHWALVSSRMEIVVQRLTVRVPLAFSHGHNVLRRLPIHAKRLPHITARPRAFS